MPEEYILVIVAPGDNIHTITHRIRETRASNIELLVPEGVRSLQNPDGFVRLGWSLDLSRIKLLVITPDEATLRAAQVNAIETVSVRRSAQAHPARLPLAGLLRAAATQLDGSGEHGSIFERLKQQAATSADQVRLWQPPPPPIAVDQAGSIFERMRGHPLSLGATRREPGASIFERLIQHAPAPVAPRRAAFASDDEPLVFDLQPFSLADLGLSAEEIAALDQDVEEPNLALTEEELAGLDLDDISWTPERIAGQPGASLPTSAPMPHDPLFDDLIALGRRQNYVDIADIIASVNDPEAEAERIEELAHLLHAASIEIRDGDEIIDMEAEYAEAMLSPDTLDLEPEVTPFSLNELELVDERMALLGMSGQIPPTPLPTEQAIGQIAALPPATPLDAIESLHDAVASGLIQPFTLTELGLSDEEIASLGMVELLPPHMLAEPPATNQPSEPSAPEQRPQEDELLGAPAFQLNARFEGVGPDQPLPSGRRVPLIVSVDTPIAADHSYSDRADKLMLATGAPLAYIVRVNASTAAWSIKVAEPTMLVSLSGETQQEAEFLIVARQPGYGTLYIAVERADTGAIVQHTWLPVAAASENIFSEPWEGYTQPHRLVEPPEPRFIEKGGTPR